MSRSLHACELSDIISLHKSCDGGGAVKKGILSVCMCLLLLAGCMRLPNDTSTEIFPYFLWVPSQEDSDLKVLMVDAQLMLFRFQLEGEIHSIHSEGIFSTPHTLDEKNPEFIWIQRKAKPSAGPMVRLISASSMASLSAVQVFDPKGNLVMARGEFLRDAAVSERNGPPSDVLRPVGDLCREFGQEGFDGKVDVWDLIFLLQRYGRSDPDALLADIGQIKTRVTLPPEAPFSTNLSDFGPDGIVDVWDLILLLKAYGATDTLVHSPIGVALDGFASEEDYPFITREVRWSMTHENDVHTGFSVYASETADPHSPTLLGRYARYQRSATITTSLPYITVVAENTSIPERTFTTASETLKPHDLLDASIGNFVTHLDQMDRTSAVVYDPGSSPPKVTITFKDRDTTLGQLFDDLIPLLVEHIGLFVIRIPHGGLTFVLLDKRRTEQNANLVRNVTLDQLDTPFSIWIAGMGDAHEGRGKEIHLLFEFDAKPIAP